MPNFYQPPYNPVFSPPFNLPQGQITPQPTGGIIWVQSEKEAASYPVAPNTAVALWHQNEPVVYLKQTDASGRPSIKTYELVEKSEQKAEYASKADFDALCGEVEKLRGMLDKKKKGDDKE